MEPASPNPFGFVDHSRFAGFGVDLIWGIDRDGASVHIRDAKRGLACGCVCPACGVPLIARKGARIAEHFAHQGKGSGCGTGRETNAHYWAKQLLIETKRIRTPPVIATVGSMTKAIKPARWMTFTDVRSEKKLGGIVPDIVLILADTRELIVEIRVMHPCGPEKIALIEANRWPAIEIDLHRLRTCQDVTVIADNLLESAPRKWLCNPLRDEAEDALRAEIARQAGEREARDARQRKRDAEARARAEQAIAAKGIALIEAATAARDTPRPPVDPAIARLIEQDDRARIDIPPSGDGFLVERATWQAMLIARFATIDDPRTFKAESFELEDAIAELQPVIAPAFQARPEKAVRAWIAERLPPFRFPDEVIADYLDALWGEGTLQTTGGGYMLADDEIVWIEREGRRLRAIDDRAATLHGLVDAIIEGLPPEEIVAFEAAIWLAAPLTNHGISANAAIAAGDDAYRAIITGLRKISAMVAGGEEAVADRLGLPVKAACERARAKKTGRLAAERAERIRRLTDAATSLWGVEGRAWLDAEPEGGGASPLERAGDDEAGLLAGLDALATARRQRDADRREAEAVAARRKRLSDAVAGWFPEERRQMAMMNQSRELESSPWDAARTEHGLLNALSVLEHQARGTARRR